MKMKLKKKLRVSKIRLDRYNQWARNMAYSDFRKKMSIYKK